MIGCQDVTVGANDYTRTKALQRLFALRLRTPSPEKLAQRIIGKRKGRLSAGDCLCGKYCHNTRRNLFHNWREGCNNSFARLLRLLCCDRRQTRVHVQRRECKQRVRSQNCVHDKQFACKRESDAHSLAALFLIDAPTPISVLRASRLEALKASQIKCRRSRVSLRRGRGTYTHVCASHSEATTSITGEALESDEAAVSENIFLRTVSMLASPSAWV